jgi:tetratricopeptide (TPR) repeat protein/transcriptional regulator with XRE-family HTH domain
MAGEPQSFRSELRRRRQRRGVSLHQLSQLTHYSKGHLGNIENGVKPPTVELAGACDAALDAHGELAALVDPPPEGRSRRPPTPRAPRLRPRQLPADIAGFVGRGEQLDQLVELLTDPSAGCVVVTGCGGVGKTALAVRAAHRLAGQFPDGQLYANLHGYGSGPAAPAEQLLDRFLRALGAAAADIPAELDEVAALYRSLLDGRQVLVVLDNAGSAEQVRPLLPAAAGSRVLVTSRDRLSPLVALDGARRLHLDVLSQPEAVALLGQLVGPARLDPAGTAAGGSVRMAAGAADPADGTGSEPADGAGGSVGAAAGGSAAGAAAALVELCARLPLAIRIAAASVVDHADRSVAEHLARLRAGDLLAGLALDGDPQAAVRANLDLSYDRLDGDGQRLFRRLGLVPGPDFTAGAAAALVGGTAPAAARLLDRLAAVSLVERHAGDRYLFHDLLRRYAAERARHDDPEPVAAGHRLLRWYLHRAQAAAELLYPGKVRLPGRPAGPGAAPAPVGTGFDTREEALAWLDAELANLVAAAAAAAGGGGPPESAWLLADALRGYFWTRRCAAEWFAVARPAVAAATAAADPLGRAAAELNLADAHWSMGDYPPALAHYTAAYELAGQAGWLEGEAAACTNRGNVQTELGRLAAAAADYRAALARYEQTGQPMRQAAALANLGAVHHQSGRLEQAAEHYARALDLHRTTMDQAGQALTLNVIGIVQHDLGRLAEALATLTQASALSTEIGDRYGQARAAENLARTHCDAGRYAPALECARTSLQLAREIGDRNGEAQALSVLAAVQDRLGRREQALAGFQQAARLARDLDLPSAEAESLIGAGRTELNLDRAGAAGRLASEALALTRRLGFRVLEGQALSLLADAELRAGRFTAARERAGQALACHRDTGHQLGLARALATLGRLHAAAGDPAAARAAFQQARELLAAAGAGPEADWVPAVGVAQSANPGAGSDQPSGTMSVTADDG